MDKEKRPLVHMQNKPWGQVLKYHFFLFRTIMIAAVAVVQRTPIKSAIILLDRERWCDMLFRDTQCEERDLVMLRIYDIRSYFSKLAPRCDPT